MKIPLLNKAAVFAVFAFALALTAQAAIKNVSFPIAELGNCGSETECRAFCDNADNFTACTQFAKKQGFASDEQVKRAEKFATIVKNGGPGGCRTEAACEAYCESTDHIDECMDFASRNGLIEEKEVAEAKKVSQALKQGTNLPGNCRGKKQCEAYCASPDHFEECIAFAEKAGFIPKEEIAKVRKVQEVMRKGETPGGCRSKESCESYCASGDHIEECATFAEKLGVINSQDAQRMRKTGGRGPGGCVGEACRDFCENPANQQVCMDFARQHGFLDEHQGGPQGERPGFPEGQEGPEGMMRGTPPPGTSTNRPSAGPAFSTKTVACLKASLQPEIVEKLLRGAFQPTGDIEQIVRKCVSGAPLPPPGEGDRPNFGGCTSAEECTEFCTKNPEQCGIRPDNQRPQSSGVPPEFLNGGGTNLPPPSDRPTDLRPTSRGIGSSLLGLVLRLFMIGGGIGQ